jgi:hypothetical protein
MTAMHAHPDPFEILRAELVEGLARMVRRVMEAGKGEAQAALEQLGASARP